MSPPTLLTPTSKLKPLLQVIPKTNSAMPPSSPKPQPHHPSRRHFFSLVAVTSTLSLSSLLPATPPAFEADEEEYVKETSDVINKMRSTINMDKNDPNVATAVAELRDTSNSWVAKYRREKFLLGRASFREIYSALNAVSEHYISFRPKAPIPAKRKARILEEMDIPEKALSRGR
ncbi:Photosystem II repair protein PSB27-H1 [Hibiscus syriacus]|uniref:Photosystem II repair protein PSB27-H1 n=1 Tax=Hibiscus syriacus TaxID=106335 RepID=A0A6A2YCW9_HIBSY|nr:photosystem II repair protein PSB27-H1, chloroplastic-like [Hibiscus syriacus]KAE8669704.1 Photosystem II repair protein PSB27-H1 [Hibiscus syriacus]